MNEWREDIESELHILKLVVVEYVREHEKIRWMYNNANLQRHHASYRPWSLELPTCERIIKSKNSLRGDFRRLRHTCVVVVSTCIMRNKAGAKGKEYREYQFRFCTFVLKNGNIF